MERSGIENLDSGGWISCYEVGFTGPALDAVF
jgi:hypothetical protein